MHRTISYLAAILLRVALADVESAGDEVVLHIHYQEGTHRTHDLGNSHF